MMNLGMPELILIFLVVLLLFGGNRIVEIAKGLGNGIKEFKKSLKDSEPSEPDDKSKE